MVAGVEATIFAYALSSALALDANGPFGLLSKEVSTPFSTISFHLNTSSRFLACNID